MPPFERFFPVFQLPEHFLQKLPKVFPGTANNSVGRLDSKEKPKDAIPYPI